MSNLQRVIIVPRNGYINRIQAWASSAILASELGANCSVMWESEPVAGAAASDFFREDALTSTFISAHELTSLLGQSHDSMPRYLTVLESQGVVVLAGHDRGEQAFMIELAALLDSHPTLHTLVIIAGGIFSLPGTTSFREKRGNFYAALPWSQAILDRLSSLTQQNVKPSYLALHIRGTDRSIDAPTDTSIATVLKELLASQEIRSLFIAADSSESLNYWVERTTSLGYLPWSLQVRTLDRSSVIAGIDAMADWISLGNSQSLIYSATSSYAHEAAVATGNFESCISLQAGAARKSLRKVVRVGQDVVLYPSRHGWLRSPS